MEYNDTTLHPVSLVNSDWIRAIVSIRAYAEVILQDYYKAAAQGNSAAADILWEEYGSIDAVANHIEFVTPELL